MALARTIITDPDILLFDEPLSSLDAKLRDELKIEIRRLHQETGKTTIYVTHDQGEAFAIADKVYVMHDGRVEQEGTPLDLYAHPTSPFVAGFIGTNNFIPAVAGSQDAAQGGQLQIEALGCRVLATGGDGIRQGDRVLLLVRPEDIAVLGAGPSHAGANSVGGRIAASTFAGTSTHSRSSWQARPSKSPCMGRTGSTTLPARGERCSCT